MGDIVDNLGLSFEDRFLERHAGPIIADTSVALVELVANSWDAWATHVEIVWPEAGADAPFSISDNGKGMTSAQFEMRWKTLDYNRLRRDGKEAHPPPELADLPVRAVYGRNGKGRHAAFRFGDAYRVRTWSGGHAAEFVVRRGLTQPFTVELLRQEDDVEGHGTTITAIDPAKVVTTPEEAREVIGTRFLADPNFSVSINGTKVTFEDIPASQRSTIEIVVAGFGVAGLTIIDAQRADRTTRQHGIAWRVGNRIVGVPGWSDFDRGRLLDGRSSEAKRFLFIVRADFLADDVLSDWSSFRPDSDAWTATRSTVYANVREYLGKLSADRRRDTKVAVRESLGRQSQNCRRPVGTDGTNSWIESWMPVPP